MCRCASLTRDPLCASPTLKAGMPCFGISTLGAFAFVVKSRITMRAPSPLLRLGLWSGIVAGCCCCVLSGGSCIMGSVVMSLFGVGIAVPVCFMTSGVCQDMTAVSASSLLCVGVRPIWRVLSDAVAPGACQNPTAVGASVGIIAA
jgi:hypothetical protein